MSVAAAAARRWVLGAVLSLACLTAPAAQLTPWRGDAAPALSIKDLSGVQHDLAQYKGKVVLVNFWATWCEPCRDEMPSMERLRQRYSDAPFAVLAVNVDEPEQRIRAFLQRMPLKFTVLTDPGMRATRAWNARVLPASFLIGRDGRIRYSVRGELDWSSDAVVRIVAELLKAS